MSTVSGFRMAAVSAAVLVLVACGGGGGGSGSSGTTGGTGGNGGGSGTITTSYTVGGSVSGLTGTGLVLQNNGGNNLSVAADGSFTFSTALANGTSYSISVSTQPAGQTCSVSNGSGTVSTGAITNVSVSCRSQVARFLYVPNKLSNTISVYSIDASTGALTAVGTPVATGVAPSLVTVDRAEKYLYVANSGSLTVAEPSISGYSINSTTGALTPLAGSPFPLSVSAPPGVGGASLSGPVLDSAGKFGFVVNAFDRKLYGARVDANTGGLTEIAGMPISYVVGPGYPVFDTTGKYLYVPYSEPSGPTLVGYVMAYQVDPTSGVLTPIRSPVPTGDNGATFAQRDPSGKLLVLSNGFLGTTPGHTLSVFSIDSSTGTLTAVPGSPFDAGGPVQIVSYHPTKSFVFALTSDLSANGSIVIFQMDSKTGVLTKTGAPDVSVGLRPVLPGVEPTGKFLVVTNTSSNSFMSFSIDQATGALTQVAGSPFATDQQPSAYRPDPSWKYLYSVNVAANTVSSYSLNATTGAVALVNSVATGIYPGYVALVGRQ